MNYVAVGLCKDVLQMTLKLEVSCSEGGSDEAQGEARGR